MKMKKEINSECEKSQWMNDAILAHHEGDLRRNKHNTSRQIGIVWLHFQQLKRN